MKIQQQPDYLIFADDAKTGEVQNFPNILRGWGVTIDQTQSKPPMEWMNGAFNRVDKNMLYLLQQGVPEWNTQVLYPAGAVIKYKNILYIAKLENDNAIPSTNTTKWERLVKDATTEVAGSVKLNSAVNSTSEIEAATPKAVKVAYDLANTANITSNTANTTANIAKTNAATAQTKADSAYALASTTKTTAETDATTTLKGRVQLNDTVTSTATNQAATSRAVKQAYDLANGRLPLAGGTVTGNTNFTGKLQQAGNDVITNKTISSYLSNYIGEIRFFSFRKSELPQGWYFMNGDNFLVTSSVGIALKSLSTTFKTDWRIMENNNNINLPTAFNPDGRGVFFRAVNGLSRQVGSFELDALQKHEHVVRFGQGYYNSDGLEIPTGTVASREVAKKDKTTGIIDGTNTSNETRSLNIGMTPAIYLGV